MVFGFAKRKKLIVGPFRLASPAASHKVGLSPNACAQLWLHEPTVLRFKVNEHSRDVLTMTATIRVQLPIIVFVLRNG